MRGDRRSNFDKFLAPSLPLCPSGSQMTRQRLIVFYPYWPASQPASHRLHGLMRVPFCCSLPDDLPPSPLRPQLRPPPAEWRKTQITLAINGAIVTGFREPSSLVMTQRLITKYCRYMRNARFQSSIHIYNYKTNNSDRSSRPMLVAIMVVVALVGVFCAIWYCCSRRRHNCRRCVKIMMA